MSRRRIAMPIWAVVGVALLLGALGGGLAVALATRNDAPPLTPVAASSPTASLVDLVASPSLTPSGASSSAAGAATPSQTPTSSKPTPKPTLKPLPKGTLLVGFGAGHEYGQGIPTGKCVPWTIEVKNQSNTAIERITFAPVSADYEDWSVPSPPRTKKANRPGPTVLDVYLNPGDESVLKWTSCTTTPWPGGSYELDETLPSSVSFRWVTGHTGRASL